MHVSRTRASRRLALAIVTGSAAFGPSASATPAIMPASAAVPLSNILGTDCAGYADGSIAFRQSSTCAALTNVGVEMRTPILGTSTAAKRSFRVFYRILTPATNAVSCRVRWKNFTETIFGGPTLTASSGSGSLTFENDGSTAELPHWVSCTVKTGTQGAPNSLHWIRWTDGQESSVHQNAAVPAAAGTRITAWQENNCGFYSDGSVSFRASSTCAVGSTQVWDFPALIEFTVAPQARDFHAYWQVGTAATDAVKCRVFWRDSQTNALGASNWQTRSTVGTGSFSWDDTGDNGDFIHWVSCAVKVGNAATPNYLRSYRWAPMGVAD
jgi:hypothetical protein